jgi:hypothetical protein
MYANVDSQAAGDCTRCIRGLAFILLRPICFCISNMGWVCRVDVSSEGPKMAEAHDNTSSIYQMVVFLSIVVPFYSDCHIIGMAGVCS